MIKDKFSEMVYHIWIMYKQDMKVFIFLKKFEFEIPNGQKFKFKKV